MFTHNLDPILFDFGFIAIRWYSLAYIGGILAGWWLGKKLINKRFKTIGRQFALKKFDDLITYLIISMIIGGRIGYIVFYNLEYYLSNPLNTADPLAREISRSAEVPPLRTTTRPSFASNASLFIGFIYFFLTTLEKILL